MANMDTDPTVRPFRSHNLSWLTIMLAVATVITFFITANPDMSGPIPVMMGNYKEGSTGSGAPSMPARDMSIAPDYYPYPGTTPDAGDTREFLKTNYSAEMLTRNLESLSRRVLTTVRGHGGRIDQESVSPTYGYVSFVVPMSTYEAFRTELESLVGSRFISVSISSENFLPQKQSIEEQQKQADTALATAQSVRAKLVATGASAEEIAAADARITWIKDWQKAIRTQDKALLDNLATVQGTVSLHWISVWELVQLYVPGYSIPGIFAALTLLSLWRDRRRVASAGIV